MSSYTEYTTKQGDRFDLIAFKAYGDASRSGDIIKANRGIAIAPVLPAGIKLLIPVIDVATISADNLPPWKR